MTDNTLKLKNNSLVALFFALGFSIAAFFLSSWAKVYTGTLFFFASLNTFVFSILLFNEYRLLHKSEVEEEEQADIRKSAGASQELFEESDEALMLASRSLKSWRKYILPIFCLIYGIGIIIFLVYSWRAWQEPIAIDSKSKMAAAACTGAIGVCYFLMGAFFSGASRQSKGLLLRPFSEWSFLNSILCAVLVVVLFLGAESYPKLDLYASKVILTIFIFLAFELSVNFLVDWYRPRFHKEEKSILESRFLAVFTDSGSIAANIAHALDYQFGLKVTEAGFYKFFRKTLLPLLLIQLSTLYLLSCFTLIEVGERGIKETFGKINEKEELTPSLYVHLPYPFTKVHIYPADQIMSIEVGLAPKAGGHDEEPPMDEEQSVVNVTEDIVLWKKKGHHKEGMEDIPYVVSVDVEEKDANDNIKKSKEYNRITVLIPIHFRIKDHKEGEISPLYQYLFKYKNAKSMLKAMAEDVVVKYLAESEYFYFLGKNRVAVAADLKAKLQTKVNEQGLGIEIVMIALETTHPPGAVAPAYDEVMAAEYDKDRLINDAKVNAVSIRSQARIDADREISEAK